MTVTPLVPAPAFRGRIGRDPRSGHYAVPRRYRLHLSPGHDDCLGIAVVHRLLGLAEICPVTLLASRPDCPDGGYADLRPLYEASAHHYRGPAVAPVLSDGWSGRIVSTHARDIMRDLARSFTPPAGPVHPAARKRRSPPSRSCAPGPPTPRRCPAYSTSWSGA
ncbi:hypothetical protein SVIOM342S_00058 [Streptomyces violaceorubidus]